MISMALNRAGVADCSWSVWIGRFGRRWIAAEAGEEELAERSQRSSAGIEFLVEGLVCCIE
jgi:hypothetical protein